MYFFSPGVFLFCLGVLPGYNPGSGIEFHSYKSALVIVRYAQCSDTGRAKMSLACCACAHLWRECIDKLCIPNNLLIFLIAIGRLHQSLVEGERKLHVHIAHKIPVV